MSHDDSQSKNTGSNVPPHLPTLVGGLGIGSPTNAVSGASQLRSPKIVSQVPVKTNLDEANAAKFFDSLQEQLKSHDPAAQTGGRMPSGDATPGERVAFELSQFTKMKDWAREIEKTGLRVKKVFHNASPAVLYEEALKNEEGSYITNTGALLVSSGTKTGRSPADKRITEGPDVEGIWWGKVNIKLPLHSFLISRERAVDYLNTREQLYVVDGYAGWDKAFRIPVRIIACRAYHALFMQNMLVEPTLSELQNFEPKFVVYNAGPFPANRYTTGMTSPTTVALSFERGEMVILGTEYAGEMKKGILTLMMYQMPRLKQLPLHSSANIGPGGDLTFFFGLSGTGKTTLSADPKRRLIGDDEHVWTDTGVFNIEGGCYAKAIGLTRESEPEIFDAVKFGAVVENVVMNKDSRVVDYSSKAITENTRACYPLSFIPNALIPAVADVHPRAVVLLCCDAFGVLPPVSRLTNEQVQYYFISGYTAKVAGTEQGVTEPTATFSACFGAPFLVWQPIVYAKLLAERLKKHSASAYLLNTGWVGGAYRVGKRCPLKYTRKIVDAINDGSLAKAPTKRVAVFNLEVPTGIPGVTEDILDPRAAWSDKAAYDAQAKKLANLFARNFDEYRDQCPQDVLKAGPEHSADYAVDVKGGSNDIPG